jgi:serine/threonine protein kinase
MELVKGILITKYCDQEKLSTQARLDLFVKVCHAIQHAHQKGIIHRDIKPSNIMVTLHDGVPVPKVIDFGIAKATEKELTEKTIYTRYSQFIGTPAYTSPEQAEMSGLDIDTRSDIYSLGVLLYELLTGKTPFDAKELIQSGIDEMRRIIREEEPVRPSTRLSQTLAAEQVRTSSRQLLQELKGYLDWIVMKCLENRPTASPPISNGTSTTNRWPPGHRVQLTSSRRRFVGTSSCSSRERRCAPHCCWASCSARGKQCGRSAQKLEPSSKKPTPRPRFTSSRTTF